MNEFVKRKKKVEQWQAREGLSVDQFGKNVNIFFSIFSIFYGVDFWIFK